MLGNDQVTYFILERVRHELIHSLVVVGSGLVSEKVCNFMAVKEESSLVCGIGFDPFLITSETNCRCMRELNRGTKLLVTNYHATRGVGH